MPELFDEDYFNKRGQTIRRQAGGQKWATILLVILLVLVVAGVLFWKWKNNPDTKIININKASVEELQYLPGVGPATASDIVKGRPYSTPEDLKKVKGIGEKTYEKMQPRVRVE